MLVARASRHVTIQRSVQVRNPGVPIFLKQVLSAPTNTEPLRSAGLRAIAPRLRVISPRRLPALACLLGAWALLLLLACAVRPAARAWALRAGGLGVLWAPPVTMLTGALQPSAPVEYATIALTCLALGALTDRLAPWPRAPLAPALVTLAAITIDALAGTQLLIRALLGPDPALGVRFYGIGNALKSGLAVLVFAAVAAALYPTARDSAPDHDSAPDPDPVADRDLAATIPNLSERSRAALAMAGAGTLLAVVEGSARIGAGVGGVILVAAGTAVATVLLLPGALTRRRVLAILAAPVAGLVLLAALDLLTAHGQGHYTRSVLHARSASALGEEIADRYTAAWHELGHAAMPFVTALALLAAALGVHRRERLLRPIGGDPAWRAALAGGLTAGVVGALVEDSGPVLLVVAVLALACVLAYLHGRPATQPASRHAEFAQSSSRKGFSTRTEPITWPSLRSSVSRRRQPARAAAATTRPSQ